MHFYAAYARGVSWEMCEVESDATGCMIEKLNSSTEYTVELMACDKSVEQTTAICSAKVVWKHGVMTLPAGKHLSVGPVA